MSKREISKGAGNSLQSASTPGNVQESGRTITSGDFSSNSRSADITPQDSVKKGVYREPEPRPPERVVILQKAEKAAEDQQGGAEVAAELPVPTSAFAALKGGESAKSSADLSPFSGTVAAKQEQGSEGESGSPDEDGVQRPSKRHKMARTVSINTILQRVDSKEAPLADVIGTAPQTVEDIVALQSSGNALTFPGDSARIGDAPKTEDQPIPVRKAMPLTSAVPSLPPRKSSEQSTVEHQRNIAMQDSANTVEMEVATARGKGGLTRPTSVERDLHMPPTTSRGTLVETGAAPPTPTTAPPSAKEAAEGETKVVIWSGKIKHRLKTAEGASTVELFSVSALVPEKLLEQMPSTLFVSALAGRANVRLGKHYVTQCRLENLDDKQMQKVVALASMKLVAICELQHCTLTLVPFSDSRQGLRIVGFMIADD